VPYAGLLLVIGYWHEVRYWMTLLPFLIPLALFSLELDNGARIGKPVS
jgi:hypothetical protein